MKNNYILALDVGTTGIKCFIFDGEFRIRARIYAPLHTIKKQEGIVEQSPEEIITITERAMRAVLKESGLNAQKIKGIGVTNQRETIVMWDAKTGKSIYPAIVWEDTRTQKWCSEIEKKLGKKMRAKTGLPVLPYFSASKIAWILKNNTHAKKLIQKKQLRCGTVDTWLLWNFLEENSHVTDITNASRTLLFNLRTRTWDSELLSLWDIPKWILPKIKPSSARFGVLKKKIFGVSIPVMGVCGDQQASLYAAGHENKTTKITYGTGAFLMQCVGNRSIMRDGFFTTLSAGGRNASYALEAKIVGDSGERVAKLLESSRSGLKIYLTELTKKTNEYVKKLPYKPKNIVIDGGITQVPYLVDLQSEIFGIPVKRQAPFDGTALGIAKLVKDNF